MTPSGSYDRWIGRDVHDSTGNQIGTIKDIFYDDVSGRPEWASLEGKGLKGDRLVPLVGAQVLDAADADDEDDGRLVVSFTGDKIQSAPEIRDDHHLGPDEEKTLYSHYGFDWTARDDTHGYGEQWRTPRFDNDYERLDRRDEQVDTVPVHTTANVTVPVDAQVRLRRYQTENQRTETRTVQVPVTETEEHVEVDDVSTSATSRPLR